MAESRDVQLGNDISTTPVPEVAKWISEEDPQSRNPEERDCKTFLDELVISRGKILVTGVILTELKKEILRRSVFKGQYLGPAGCQGLRPKDSDGGGCSSVVRPFMFRIVNRGLSTLRIAYSYKGRGPEK